MTEELDKKLFARLNSLFDKYSIIDDKDDDEIDVFKMEISKDRGKTKKSNVVDVGSLFKKKYKRNAVFKKEKYGLKSFHVVYNEIFGCHTFNDLYLKYIKE